MDTRELGITNTQADTFLGARAFDLSSAFQNAYTELYRIELDDSPPTTRQALYARMQPAFSLLPAGSSVLDLGSGRQIFENEYARMLTAGQLIEQPLLHAANTAKIYTLDFADIEQSQLLAAENPNVIHVHGSAEQMEFPDASFDLAFSNLALDFMPPEAIPELWRVLKPGAKAFLNLHHPTQIIPPDIDDRVRNARRKVNQQRKFARRVNPTKQKEFTGLRVKQALKDNQKLYSDVTDIYEVFTIAGFEIESLEEVTIRDYHYWAVDIKKPRQNSSESITQFAAD